MNDAYIRNISLLIEDLIRAVQSRQEVAHMDPQITLNADMRIIQARSALAEVLGSEAVKKIVIYAQNKENYDNR